MQQLTADLQRDFLFIVLLWLCEEEAVQLAVSKQGVIEKVGNL